MLETFRPLLDAARGLDLSDPVAAREELNRRLDPASEAGLAVSAGLKALLEAGSIADRGELPVKWGRVAKATPETDDHSIDAVHMTGAGPSHTHPAGEVNWCIPLEGEPQFESTKNGWCVMPPGSTHVPEVTGGAMLIVYLIPTGAIEFHA
tara:strand:- start:455 stop:907 length:453 start_codon:yes stop_codon:yes gene_type:complete